VSDHRLFFVHLSASRREHDEGVELVREIGQPGLGKFLLGFREEGLPLSAF